MRIELRRGSWIGWTVVLWIALEAVLFWLFSGTFGVLATIAALALKGVVGLMLLVAHLRSVMAGLAGSLLSRGLSGLGSTGFAALGAFLIVLPGFLTTLAGLALFSPSVRLWLVNTVRRRGQKRGGDGTITLEAGEWQEVSTRRPRRTSIARPGKVVP